MIETREASRTASICAATTGAFVLTAVVISRNYFAAYATSTGQGVLTAAIALAVIALVGVRRAAREQIQLTWLVLLALSMLLFIAYPAALTIMGSS